MLRPPLFDISQEYSNKDRQALLYRADDFEDAKFKAPQIKRQFNVFSNMSVMFLVLHIRDKTAQR